MNVLDAPIPAHHGQIEEGLASALIGELWGLSPSAGPAVAFSDLLEFYISQITILRGDEPAVRSNQHVVDLVNFVLNRCSESLNAGEAELTLNRPPWLGQSPKAPKAAINLAIRLAFMVNPKHLPDRNQPIGTAVKGLFPRSTASDSGERIDHHFNERSLQKVGFKVMRTSYLSEHLSLDQPNKTVRLFAHAEFLKSYRNDGVRAVYPEGLLEETMETVKLLNASDGFQMFNRGPVDWNNVEGDIEMGFGEPPSLEIDEYHFWREKLVTLHEAYRKAKPTSLKQWWQDRRDSSQWTTFWLAVVAILLTLLFGLIQSISGIIQAVATYHSQPCVSP